MKGGLLDYITNHAHFYQFRYRQLLSRLSSRWPELDRDDEMMMKCWDASGKLPLEALRLFPQRKKQTNSWTEWRDIQKVCSCDTATKKNTTTLLSEFSSSSDGRYEWKQGVHQKNRNKDYIREIKLLFSPHPTNTRPLERRIICVWFSSASYMWDVTLAKRKLCLFPVLPSPAVMVQRRPQQWSRRGMLLHSWSHSSLSLSPSL